MRIREVRHTRDFSFFDCLRLSLCLLCNQSSSLRLPQISVLTLSTNGSGSREDLNLCSERTAI